MLFSPAEKRRVPGVTPGKIALGAERSGKLSAMIHEAV